MELPEGMSNARYIFTNDGIVDPMSFSLGCQGDIGQDAQEQAQIASSNFKEFFAYDDSALLAGWTFVGVQVTKTTGGLPQIGQSIIPVVGSGVAPGLVANSGLLIRKNTALGGRKYRGRMYWPPFALGESSVTVSGAVDSSYLINQSLVINQWFEAMTTGTNPLPPWLLHSNERDPDTGEEIPDTAADPTPITGFSVQGVVATQRRRIR